MKRKITLFLSVALILAVTGCTTISYSAKPTYVGFSSSGVKSVQQVKKTSYGSDVLVKTFDDEFIYDDEGDIIKHTQTQYFDDGEKFDEYVITYQKIGGVLLPKSAAINGIVYMEADYDLLPVDNEGKIPEYSSIPSFCRSVKDYVMLDSYSDSWTMDIGNFDVPFRVDGRYVESENKFNYYSGFDKDNVITAGYDNILLQRFYYSNTKFKAGYNISLGKDAPSEEDLVDEGHNNTTFLFEWGVVADKLVQKKVTVVENFPSLKMTFSVDRDFDQAARITGERWSVFDSEKNTEPVVLFEQTLAY